SKIRVSLTDFGLAAARELPPVFIQVAENKICRAVGAFEHAQLGDAAVSSMGGQLAVRFFDLRRGRHSQRETIHRSQILTRTSLQDDDVPGRRRMFDVLGRIETGGDLQSQNLDIKTAASRDVVTLQRAVS